MARENYKRALAATLKWEGGYVNHPDDPGGATMKGVTQKVFDAYCDEHSTHRRQVKTIKDDELQAIYREQYWNVIRGDKLPAGLDFAVFDFAVNSGVSRAVKTLQGLLGVKPDGVMALVTLDAAQYASTEMVESYCEARLAFVRKLKTFKTFGKGWTSRITGVKRLAIEMAAHNVAALDDIGLPAVDPEDDEAIPTAVAFADARPPATSMWKSKEGWGSISIGGYSLYQLWELTHDYVEDRFYLSDILRAIDQHPRMIFLGAILVLVCFMWYWRKRRMDLA